VDRVGIIHNGIVWVEGTAQEFISSSDPIVREFVGEGEGG